MRFRQVSSRLLLLGGLVCGLFSAGCAVREGATQAEDEGASGHSVDREDLKFAIEKGIDAVEIVNALGEINVRNREQDEVAVHGVVQRLAPDFGRARVESSREGNTLRLTVALPEGKVGGRYDMAAYVPSGMPLILRGTSHRIDARKRAAPLTVVTTSGNINASSEARLDIQTESGLVKATARKPNWSGISQVRSRSGRIQMLFPLSGDVTLEAETGGRLSTDFGLSVHPRADGGFYAKARYGAGTNPLRIESESGEVILEQAVLLEQDGG